MESFSSVIHVLFVFTFLIFFLNFLKKFQSKVKKKSYDKKIHNIVFLSFEDVLIHNYFIIFLIKNKSKKLCLFY